MSNTPRIAFIGLGNMGAPMAINLQKAGFSVSAFDLSADAMSKVSQQGVTAVVPTADEHEDRRSHDVPAKGAQLLGGGLRQGLGGGVHVGLGAAGQRSLGGGDGGGRQGGKGDGSGAAHE